MLKKLILIAFTLVVVSFFYYSFDPFFLPRGYNTKMVMAAVGLVILGWEMLKSKDLTVSKPIITLAAWSAIISLIALFAMVFNGTIDTAYATYITSMAVWLSSAFVMCYVIKSVHGRIDVEIVAEYLVAVSVIQCFLALWIDNNPALQNFVDTRIVRGTQFMHEIKRLYGIGCGLDTAGIHFSLCLIMIAYLLKKNRRTMTLLSSVLYILSYVVIAIVGSMIARTTYVGIGLSIGYLFLTHDYSSVEISKSTLRILMSGFAVFVVGVVFAIYEYNHDAGVRHWIRFAFEGFFNYFERGEYSVASNETLQNMVKWPTKIKTWIIGDGYFTNPYYNDPNFIWQGQNKQGYYMDTDIGYIRFIFYFGVIGLGAFAGFFLKCTQMSIKLLKEYKGLIIFTLFTGLIVWMKVATDVFFQFALYICIGLMMEKPVEEEQENQLESSEGE
ncbi:MAG: hypothetical protein MJZ16_03725 [Bacteroidales bacterium]|nr:hypothetical protein [Bacteroidales bacterium]